MRGDSSPSVKGCSSAPTGPRLTLPSGPGCSLPYPRCCLGLASGVATLPTPVCPCEKLANTLQNHDAPWLRVLQNTKSQRCAGEPQKNEITNEDGSTNNQRALAPHSWRCPARQCRTWHSRLQYCAVLQALHCLSPTLTLRQKVQQDWLTNSR